MINCQKLNVIFLATSVALAGNVSAQTNQINHHESNHSNHQEQQDFSFTPDDLKKLKLSSVSILNDDSFVFNNDLILLDWDSTFDSYMPQLKEHQETIMHYAGYYSLNPKLLISLMESKSKIVSNPTSESYQAPFGNLSSKTGFNEQVKDIASKLTKRFYAFRKLQISDKKSQGLMNSSVPTSAATVALTSLLNSTQNVIKSNEKHDKSGENIEVSNELNNIDVFQILTAYEDVFVEDRNKLLKHTSTSNDLNKKPQMVTNAVAAPNLYLPWTSGWNWRTSGGAHGFDGSTWPLSSLDFYYPYGNTGWGGNKPAVYASHGGTVTWYSRCNMRITHASGLATNYYHMDNLQYGSGSYINAGTYIGSYANTKSASLCEGGQSSGPHLHISLLRNGYYASLQGYNFSGFYVNVGSTQYDSNCSRSYLWKAGTTYCHGTNIYKPYE